MTFYNLKDALSLEGCSICFLTKKSVARYIDNLFYENVNDPKVNKEIIASQGFCKRHSDMILKTKESLGIAIIYKRIIDNLIKTNFEKRQCDCPVCKVEKEAESRYAETFVDYWGNDVKKIFETSSILCVSHFRYILKLMKDKKHREELLCLQIKKYEELSEELEEYSRKFDYRFAKEEMGHEKDSWLRAVKLIEIKREKT
jgi:hypothetical protein